VEVVDQTAGARASGPSDRRRGDAPFGLLAEATALTSALKPTGNRRRPSRDDCYGTRGGTSIGEVRTAAPPLDEPPGQMAASAMDGPEADVGDEDPCSGDPAAFVASVLVAPRVPEEHYPAARPERPRLLLLAQSGTGPITPVSHG
jgi:hypothetical protein